ncbi:hypothetical protein LINGRAHAP2_LOCUS7344 [Linum grandiflorum]
MMMMTRTNKNLSRGVVLIMIVLIFSCVFPIPTIADSPSESSSPSPSSSKSDNEDSKDEKASTTVKEICESMVKATECEEFLGNSPKADPTHIVKFNLRVLKSLVEEGTYISTKDQLKNPSTPEKMKKSLDTCVQNYDKAVTSLDAVGDACRDCEEDVDSSKNKKCKPEHIEKITSMLNDAVSNFKKCSEALDTADSPPKPWIKELNEAMIDGAHFLSEVATKIK